MLERLQDHYGESSARTGGRRLPRERLGGVPKTCGEAV